jgi:hypothetical protein
MKLVTVILEVFVDVVIIEIIIIKVMTLTKEICVFSLV